MEASSAPIDATDASGDAAAMIISDATTTSKPPPPHNNWAAVATSLAMAAHPRLGAEAPEALQNVAASRDLLLCVMRHISLVVPDDAPTLQAALRRAAPWQRVLLRSGEHLTSSGTQTSVLRVGAPIELCGEPNTVLRGTLVLEAACAGGAIRNLRLEDGGDCCVRIEGGCWELSRLRLRCSHGAAVLACGSARVALSDCVCGGESEHEVGVAVEVAAYGAVQEMGLAKRACYAMVVRDAAALVASRCELRQCSEAAVLVAHRARALLEATVFNDSTAALMAGQGRGRAIELRGCTVESSVGKLWFDQDRPTAFVWGAGSENHALADARRGAAGESDDEEEADGSTQIVQPPPRGDDSSDTDSLQDADEFADMERLMQELDDAAISDARSAALN